MKRNIFKSKKLYFTNIIFNIILLIVSILSLKTLIFSKAYSFTDKEQLKEIILYFGYSIIYFIALILLIIKPPKGIFYLNIIYSLAILFNFNDFIIHYSKYAESIHRVVYIVLIIIFTLVFASFIYLNNKKKFKIDFLELEEIGKHKE
ncbi:hypothetical protein [Chryseobacterium daecheongense]|uniref:Uncharacterized protein n=1 Tax=Chryseobacterium daecheongense TaxID=192389 RepID=A0A3N0W2X4_9FLAO|nr:hypothetical protein [Chryseobacterium daecheongense]ROH99409.1 hypothetical protein EGI05_00490 [Chryseobacterium daecheongense]TDX95694.1 hypothetical protein BCF50_1477 [Chryseobacterium daecheongense]